MLSRYREEPPPESDPIPGSDTPPTRAKPSTGEDGIGPPILDEPTAGADEEPTSLVLNALEEWTRASAAVLVVTHGARLVERADRRVALGAGEQVHAHPRPERQDLDNPAW